MPLSSGVGFCRPALRCVLACLGNAVPHFFLLSRRGIESQQESPMSMAKLLL
jgi:hypothetical protein